MADPGSNEDTEPGMPTSLPLELLQNILSELPVREIARARRISKMLRDTIDVNLAQILAPTIIKHQVRLRETVEKFRSITKATLGEALAFCIEHYGSAPSSRWAMRVFADFWCSQHYGSGAMADPLKVHMQQLLEDFCNSGFPSKMRTLESLLDIIALALKECMEIHGLANEKLQRDIESLEVTIVKPESLTLSSSPSPLAYSLLPLDRRHTGKWWTDVAAWFGLAELQGETKGGPLYYCTGDAYLLHKILGHFDEVNQAWRPGAALFDKARMLEGLFVW